MDQLTTLLYLLVGLLIGGLVTLLLDSYFLGQRVRSAFSAKRRVEDKLVSVERRLARSGGSTKRLADELEVATEAMVRQADATENLKNQLEIADAELAIMRDNLKRIDDHAETLRSERDEFDRQATKALARQEALQGRVDQLGEQIDEATRARDNALQSMREAQGQLQQAYLLQLENKEPAEPHAGRLPSEETGEPDRAELNGDGPVSEGLSAEIPYERDESQPAAKTQPEAARHPSRPQQETDGSQLQSVRGIGPSYAGRLAEAGISSLADLAKQTPEYVSSIVGLRPSRSGKVAEWIEEARVLTSSLSVAESQSESDDPQLAKDL
jgi:predicted flap endonuclease-1-like 5' DNA nuclease